MPESLFDRMKQSDALAREVTAEVNRIFHETLPQVRPDVSSVGVTMHGSRCGCWFGNGMLGDRGVELSWAADGEATIRVGTYSCSTTTFYTETESIEEAFLAIADHLPKKWTDWRQQSWEPAKDWHRGEAA